MAGSDQTNTGNTGPGGSQDPNAVQEPGRPSDLSSDTGYTVDTPSSPPGGSAPAPGQDGQTAQQTPQQTEQPRTDWRDRRIGELTARNREQRAELERLRALAGQAPPNGQQQPPAQTYSGPPPDQMTIDRQVEERAAILAANQEFNRRCNDVAEAGRRVYPDFDLQVSRLVGLVDNNDPHGVATYNAFLNAALETGEASKIIHALGGDLNEASRILSLSPLKMAVELTRMASRPIHELSQAPRPLNPAATAAQAARTSTSPDDPGSDHMSTQEWMRRREEQVAAARNTRR
jgi:hypothetical protein